MNLRWQNIKDIIEPMSLWHGIFQSHWALPTYMVISAGLLHKLRDITNKSRDLSKQLTYQHPAAQKGPKWKEAKENDRFSSQRKASKHQGLQSEIIVIIGQQSNSEAYTTAQ